MISSKDPSDETHRLSSEIHRRDKLGRIFYGATVIVTIACLVTTIIILATTTDVHMTADKRNYLICIHFVIMIGIQLITWISKDDYGGLLLFTWLSTAISFFVLGLALPFYN